MCGRFSGGCCVTVKRTPSAPPTITREPSTLMQQQRNAPASFDTCEQPAVRGQRGGGGGMGEEGGLQRTSSASSAPVLQRQVRGKQVKGERSSTCSPST